MSALALPPIAAPAKASVPQGSTGAADATGFKSLLDTCIDKEAAPAEAETEATEAEAANDDAEAAVTTPVLAAPIAVPPPVVAVPLVAPPVATEAAPESDGSAPVAPPAPEAPLDIAPAIPPPAGDAPLPIAAPEAGIAPRPASVAAAPAPERSKPEPVAPAADEAIVAKAEAAPVAPAPQPAPQPASPPMRALAERTSRPLDPPADTTADAPASGSDTPDARIGAVSASVPAGVQTSPGPMAVPSDAAKDIAADISGSNEPAVDAAPVGETATSSISTTAHTRETSLSGLSRATIDATAQIAAQILRKLEGRSTRFEMALTPDDLGRVDVKLDIDSEGRLAARLAFDNPIAATDLRGRVDDLRRELEDAGFHLADDAFEFTQRDSGSSGFDRGQDARHGQNRAFAAASRLNAEIDVAQPPRWMALSLSPAGVDLKV